jgi:hypothetical protein
MKFREYVNETFREGTASNFNTQLKKWSEKYGFKFEWEFKEKGKKTLSYFVIDANLEDFNKNHDAVIALNTLTHQFNVKYKPVGKKLIIEGTKEGTNEAMGALPTRIERTAYFGDDVKHGIAELTWRMFPKSNDERTNYNFIESIAAHDIRILKHKNLMDYMDSGYNISSLGNFGNIESYQVELTLHSYEDGLINELKKMKFKVTIR